MESAEIELDAVSLRHADRPVAYGVVRGAVQRATLARLVAAAARDGAAPVGDLQPQPVQRGHDVAAEVADAGVLRNDGVEALLGESATVPKI